MRSYENMVVFKKPTKKYERFTLREFYSDYCLEWGQFKYLADARNFAKKHYLKHQRHLQIIDTWSDTVVVKFEKNS